MKTANRCGLCGASKNLVQTQCCGNWICDDADQYVMFSYSKNSCFRNHHRFTLCSSHSNEGHKGKWQNCKECLSEFDSEDYVYYGTNEYNFEKLKVVPKYPPTVCSDCSKVIVRNKDGYSTISGKFYCEACSDKFLAETLGKDFGAPTNQQLPKTPKNPPKTKNSTSGPVDLFLPKSVRWIEIYSIPIPANWGSTRIRRLLEDNGKTLTADTAYLFFNKAKDKIRLFTSDGECDDFLTKVLEKGSLILPLAEAGQQFIKLPESKLKSLLRS